MAIPYLEVFLGLLVAYLAYSIWTRLDARYPIVAALALLVVTAIVDALGATGAADTLAGFTALLLLGGIALVLVEYVRSRVLHRPRYANGSFGQPATKGEPAETTHERDRPSQQLLDHLEEETVPPVDAPGGGNEEDERPGDADSDHG
jgi:hypothetical protein